MDKIFFSALSILMAFIATISASDIYLPSMPAMVDYFGVGPNVIRMTIPSYFMGSCAASLLWGTISDSIGRRSTLLIGVSLFLGSTLICTFSSSFHMLFIARFVQGMGGVSVPVVGWATIQDLYPDDKSIKVISYFGTIMTMIPMIAPIVGGFIDMKMGWRGNFGIIAILTTISLISLFLAMIETQPKTALKKIRLIPTLQNCWSILTHRVFICSVMVFSFLSAGEWCFLTLGPFYFEKTLNLAPNVFGTYIAACALGYILGTFITPKTMSWIGLDNTILVGLCAALIGCIILTVSLFIPCFTVVIVCLGVGLYFLGASVTWGTSTSKALRCFDHMRGTASAIRGSILGIISALGGFVGSFMGYQTLVLLISFLFLTIIGATWMFYLAVKEPQGKNQHFTAS